MRLRTRGGLWGRLRMALWLAAACALVFDSTGMVVNRLLLDEAARVAAAQAAAAVRDAGRTHPSLLPQLAEQEARASLADQRGVELLEVRVEAESAAIDVHRRAHVLLADRIPALARHVDPVVTATAPFDPLGATTS